MNNVMEYLLINSQTLGLTRITLMPLLLNSRTRRQLKILNSLNSKRLLQSKQRLFRKRKMNRASKYQLRKFRQSNVTLLLLNQLKQFSVISLTLRCYLPRNRLTATNILTMLLLDLRKSSVH